ncbi:GatB/YqeY domain-containing protein [Helicobacter cappadocius]|uniref:GatB/YqeY domain-containing protein n=1 Tax=Helicobacter cappadocius TaxID=3063998 RepID=A0AA90SSQ9_9HELI|nr:MULTISPECIES: GatB/YqeY domain-containing protein [unclassified Helicobacter]MDO7253361.1 GatB/YqeY domain-containing protein [Helicobacter sp. faydin-H75]MDP2539209.1 GatB/YqeY domain-containing protein [Helicobacter sp. faydin-H76]
MSQIKEKMAQDLKTAMKNGDNFTRDTIRLLNSSIKQVEVDKRITLSDGDVISILKSAYKQRVDASIAYKEAGREDLLDKENKEMQIILQYLPKQLSDEELHVEISKTIKTMGEVTPKDMGKVMAALKHLSQVADGRRISEMVKSILNQ